MISAKTTLRNIRPEWKRLNALRSHRHRLVNTPNYHPLDETRIRLDPYENALDNYLELVESGLRHTLRRNDLEILLNGGLDPDADSDAQPFLESLCALLEHTVNVDLLPSTFAQSKEPTTASEYPKLDALLVLLTGTHWQFGIVAGATLTLFKLGSLKLAQSAKETIDNFNAFFTKLTRLPAQDFRPPSKIQVTDSVDVSRPHDLLITALNGLKTLLSRLNDFPNCRHKVLLQLLDLDTVDTAQFLSGPDMGLFLSNCQVSRWQWSLFNAHLPIDQQLWQRVSSLCDEIQDTSERFGDLHLAFSDNDIFVCDHDVVNERRRQWFSAGSKPSKTLKQLLKDYAFAPDVVKIPGSKTLFQKREKRELAARLVFTLATSVDSGPVVKCWDAGSIYFLSSPNGERLQGLPYALCLPERDLLESVDLKAAKDSQSIEDVLFPQLAKLLMEIECGFELSHIIVDCHDDGSFNKRTLEDVIHEELEKDLDRVSYLEAVKDCLKFRATYEHMAKRLRQRGQSDDYFAAARKMACTSIIKKIQQSSPLESSHKRLRGSADYEEPAWPPVSSDDNHLGISSGISDGCTSTLNFQSSTCGGQPSAKKVKFKDNNENGKLLGLPDKCSFVELGGRECTADQFCTKSPPDSSVSYSHGDYLIGLICALPIEMAACIAMLDETHDELSRRPEDQNNYVLGKIGSHNLVIACLPTGVYGTTSAATVAMDMISSFQSIRFGLMVGIAGGVPSRKVDIRLGDVVVSKPIDQISGVFQYDMGKTMQGSHVWTTGTLNKPPQVLLTAVSKLQAKHLLNKSKMCCYLVSMEKKLGDSWCNFKPPDQATDRLFNSDYIHLDPSDDICSKCEREKEHIRPSRSSGNPRIHYGPIASGNQLIRDSITRDHLAEDGIFCFEMESAGLMDRFPCLVIRGICDYADSHKNKTWQGYAAATAAAFAKEILSVVPVP